MLDDNYLRNSPRLSSLMDLRPYSPKAQVISTSQILKEIGLVSRENLEMIQTIEKSGSQKRPSSANCKKKHDPRDEYAEDLPPRLMYEIGLYKEGFSFSKNVYHERYWIPARTKLAAQSCLIAIPDRFKEQIDYNCSTFSDLKRLNEQMNKLAQHYGAFGDNSTSHAELGQIRDNLNTIRSEIKKIYQFYQKSDEQIQQEVQIRLNHINQELSQLFADYPSLTFRH